MLNALRVLDLTDERGQIAGAMLASLGAEVILIEPPGGAATRRLGPFLPDAAAAAGDRSLTHHAYARGKRSVVLDLRSSQGRRDLALLADTADVLIESGGPGWAKAHGADPEALAERNPRLIQASISAFGLTGPKAQWSATDLTIAAAAGQLSLSGDDDRPPVRIGLPQSFLHAAAEAAGAILIALYERENRSGRGQHIDVSAQQCVLQASQSEMLAHPLGADHIGRKAGGLKIGPLEVQLRWPCKDGDVAVNLLFGDAIGPFTHNLMRWVCEEGFCDEATRDKPWVDYGNLLLDGTESLKEYERVKRCVAEFLATKTKAELMTGAVERRVLVAPIATVDDVLASPQLEERDFWRMTALSTGAVVRTPGDFARFGAGRLPDLRPAPSVGVDTVSALDEARRWSRPGQPPGASPTTRPLEGLKVVDLMWVVAGPAATRVLTDHGAEVIRIETAHRTDTARTQQPFRDNVADPEFSGQYNNLNAGKLGMGLNLKAPGAKDVLLDLVERADVLCESFSPGAMAALGLDYEVLRERKPDLIMVSSSLMGQSGPWSRLAGYGNMAAALTGFYGITGWADRPPAGPFAAYTDYVSPRFLVAAILSALEHRRRTGLGQHIDVAQCEASLHFLTPALLHAQVNGETWPRAGNDDPLLYPHAVHPSAGDDRWVALACETEGQWRSLCDLLGRDDLAALELAQRRLRRSEVDAAIDAWTAARSADVAQETLQRAGIPAHQVQNTVECFEDPQLQHRSHFREVPHASQGTTWVEGPHFTLSRTPARVESGGPLLGEHTYELLTSVLGYDDDRVAELAVAGALE